MARGRRREGEQSAHTHSTSTSVGRSSAEEMTKLNSFSLLSCSGKLYKQLYSSNPSAQTCQADMLLQWLDVTAGLTLAPAPAVATVRQGSRSAPAPAAATVQQQGALSVAAPCRTFTERSSKLLKSWEVRTWTKVTSRASTCIVIIEYRPTYYSTWPKYSSL